MNVQRDFLLLVTLAAATVTPALGQTAAPEAAGGVTQSAASVPDFSYEATKEAVERDAKEHSQSTNPDNGPRADPNYKGKGLQIQLTVEDEGAFTAPWSATVTFRRALDEWLELVCAENPQWHPGTYSEVPTADKPDF